MVTYKHENLFAAIFGLQKNLKLFFLSTKSLNIKKYKIMFYSIFKIKLNGEMLFELINFSRKMFFRPIFYGMIYKIFNFNEFD